MTKKKNNPEALSNQSCRFLKQGKCKQGVSCLKSHDAKEPQNAIATNGAVDSGMDVDRGSESTASELKNQNREKRKPCRFFKQGKCAQGESCLKSHDAQGPRN